MKLKVHICAVLCAVLCTVLCTIAIAIMPLRSMGQGKDPSAGGDRTNTKSAVSTRTVSTRAVAGTIERAREFLLKGERIKALALLKEAYAEAPPRGAKDLLKAWDEIANFFVSDKGQNLYSMAESVWMMRPKEAVEVLVTAAKAEEGNIAVAILGAKAALRAQECGRADAFVLLAEAAFFLAPEVKLVRLQLQDCQNGSSSTAPALKLSQEGEWGALDSAIRLLQVKDSFRRRDSKAAKQHLALWEPLAPEDPEMWYWKWKLSLDRSAARKYLRLCSELTARRRKSFSMHPELCLHTETVESDLKSSEKSNQ